MCVACWVKCALKSSWCNVWDYGLTSNSYRLKRRVWVERMGEDNNKQ
jgi:hypothetical protein